MFTPDINLLHTVCDIARQAGEKILEIYHSEFDIVQKADNSPLTQADMAAHHIIVARLQALTPKFPILSEESVEISYDERSQWETYWLVDPLDGTREFIKRNGEFTVNIALIDQNKPILGVIYVPVRDVMYFAAIGYGAFKQQKLVEKIQVRPCPQEQIVVVGSRSFWDKRVEKFLENLPLPFELQSIGSSLKACLVAEGCADVYPRFGDTSEWDTAAAQCVVEQAGGYLTNMQLQPLLYNTKPTLLNPNFLVFADKQQDWKSYLESCL
jgi:3'(2'), 5'-bisphosphate nucleotidase